MHDVLLDPVQEQARSRQLLTPRNDPQWQLVAESYTPEVEGQVEAELALGNGSFGMRAVFPFPTPGAQPRTYVAGLFGQPSGPVRTPVLYSAPMWLHLHLTIDGEVVATESGDTGYAARATDRDTGVR